MAKAEKKQKFYRAQEAASILGLSLPTLRALAEQGKMACYQTPGGRYRYDVDGFLALAQTATKARLERKAKARQGELPFVEP